MAELIKERGEVLIRRLQQMREMDEWHLFQNFTLGLLRRDGYTDVRLSAVRNDFGRDGVAITPDGKKCFVAVSFDCSLSKIRHDAKRWQEDANREDAAVMLFVANDAPQNTKVSRWKNTVEKNYGLELRMFNSETILSAATSEGVWRETCARLGIVGHRQGYAKVSPYDGELVRRALKARPPEWLRQRVHLAQWDQLSETVRSRLIIGRPGSGKTTTIFEQLERARPETVLVVESDLRESVQIEGLLDEAAGGTVIVFDDLQDNHTMFVDLCQSLRSRQQDASPLIAERYANVILLAATRSQEWEKIQSEIPMTVLQDLDLLDGAELTLTGLSADQCRDLTEICRSEWELVIEERLLGQAAEAAAARDATPLFVISMLAAARKRKDRTLLDEHLAGLPKDVRGLWKRYWRDLDANAQGVLRLVRLFWAAYTPPQSQLLGEAATSVGITAVQLSSGLDALERSLWLTRTAGVSSCLDVQLEVIELGNTWYELWNTFVFNCTAGVETRGQLHNGTGNFYCQYVAPRNSVRTEYARRLADAALHFEAVGSLGHGRQKVPDIALSLNNASNVYGTLAGLETTREGRASWLAKAVKAVEEAVGIYRELGVRGDLAMSLNNTSNWYSDLAGLETTRKGRASWLAKAVKAVEESIAIRRELGVRGDLAASLNNASNLYGARAGLETTRKGRASWLAKAVKAVEESIAIRRELGVCGDLAASLNNASGCYSDLAGLETTREGRASWLAKAVKAVEEAVGIYRELGVRGDLAASLNNVSVYYSDLAGLETTREGRASWLAKAVKVVEEAVGIYRELGVRGDLAMSLNNASNRYSALAGLETTREGRASWLAKAIKAVEEAVGIYRELGVRGDLAASLNNASNPYSDLAGLETTREGRASWLAKAVKAVEESIAIRRELGVRGDLASSLGSLCQHQRGLAETEDAPAEAARRLTLSQEAIDEAVGLFRHAGNTPHLLLALQDAVIARLLQAQAGVGLDSEELMKLIDEGFALAKSMEDEKRVAFFGDLKRKLTEGG
ncbi:MAG: hypothetical protein KAS72_14465 [Phycisphaerales bacterium]|nr:hypothetical protein [Phycisphaerales bacterium]